MRGWQGFKLVAAEHTDAGMRERVRHAMPRHCRGEVLHPESGGGFRFVSFSAVPARPKTASKLWKFFFIAMS